jgi:DNA topoisomerase-2
MPPKLTIKTTSKKFVPVDENEYTAPDEIDRIYYSSDMWVGSDERTKKNRLVFCEKDGIKTIEEIEMDFPDACVQIFYEGISNCVDAIVDSRGRGYKFDTKKPTIIVKMENGRISMKNTGVPIPVVKMKDMGLYIASVIFGVVGAGSNHGKDKVRHGAGRNGLGSKTLNIFSKKFTVIIYDSHNKKKFKQTWKNNMKIAEDPIITDIPGNSEDSVEIIYDMDFERFNYKTKEYPKEVYKLFYRICADTSFTAKCKVLFNDEILDYSNIKNYGALYYGEDAIKTSIVHYEFDEDTEKLDKKTGILINKETGIYSIPSVELLLVDPGATEAERCMTSFVNSLRTPEGGIHIDTLMDKLLPTIVDHINNGGGDSKTSKRKESKYKITKSKVKPYVTGIFNIRLDNPKFNSQSKTKLSSPKPIIKPLSSIFKTINTWRLITFLKNDLKSIQMGALTKTDGKKSRYTNVIKAKEANKAGTKDAHKCVIIFTEGDSASAYAKDLISLIPNGSDYYGFYPLRGKFANVCKLGPLKLAKNNEYCDIKELLGLSGAADYNNPKDVDKLRYGKVWIMTDADTDGAHIKGLIYNLFYQHFRPLLINGYVRDYRTKFLRGKKGKESVNFYTKYDFEIWKNGIKNISDWDFKYYKGLASTLDEDVEEDSKTLKVVNYTVNDNNLNFEKAFGKTRADERKDWIIEHCNLEIQPYTLKPKMNIDEFFTHEFSNFNQESVYRAIPKLHDGFKKSAGQIIWGIMLEYPHSKKEIKEIQIARLGPLIASKVDYQHNADCLSKSLISLSQDFVGSSNLPILEARGRLGTRYKNGKDAGSPRYVYTIISSYFYSIFRPEDKGILKLKEDNGEVIEPEHYYPVILTCLVNGIEGIATGFKTTIMNHNPIEIIEYTEALLTGAESEYKRLIPWYKGFTGTITMVDSKGQTFDVEDGIKDEDSNEYSDEDEEDEEDEDTETIEKDIKKKKIGSRYIEFRGVFKEISGKNKIQITEIPVGVSYKKYEEFLKKLRIDKIISSFEVKDVGKITTFEVSGMDNPTYHKLKLIRKISTNNMVLINENNIPTKYNTVESIIKNFANIRIKGYEKRKAYYTDVLQNKILKLIEKIKFIKAVVDEEIIVTKRSAKDIKADMIEMDIDPEIYASTSLNELSTDKLEYRIKELAKEQLALENYLIITPKELWLSDLSDLKKVLIKTKKYIRTDNPQYINKNDVSVSGENKKKRVKIIMNKPAAKKKVVESSYESEEE